MLDVFWYRMDRLDVSLFQDFDVVFDELVHINVDDRTDVLIAFVHQCDRRILLSIHLNISFCMMIRSIDLDVHLHLGEDVFDIRENVSCGINVGSDEHVGIPTDGRVHV